MILCLGDSLTYGSIGYSYIKFLSPRIKAVNKGENGDTTIFAYKRLIKYLENEKYSKIETYVICIGANDILLPYLKDVSAFWRLRSIQRCEDKKCITDDREFERVYEKYLQLLKDRDKKVVLVGIPLVQLQNFPQDIVKKRNAIISSLAEKYNAKFVDTYALQSSLIKSKLKTYSWGVGNITRIFDELIMLIFPFSKDLFSKIRKLELTVDGAHFNSVSAKSLAKAIEEAIKS